jgi:hypothetical protein
MNGSLRTTAPPQPQAEPASRAVLRRKCACGGDSAGGGRCAERRHRNEERAGEQPGLLRRAGPSAPGPGGDDPFGVVPSIVYDVLREPGRSLDDATRVDMEARFGGADFSGVRIHTGARAADSADAVQADAYAVGRDIVFRRGAYSPGTPAGRSLLAHELVHTTQQSVATPSSRLTIDSPRSGPERQAEAMGRAALSREVSPTRTGPGPQAPAVTSANPIGRRAVQRQERSLFDRATAALSSENRQFVSDLVESVKQSPQYAAEVLAGEVWEAIKAHWIRFSLIMLAFIGAEVAVAALTAFPEPVITKAIAGILQIVLLVFAVVFAGIEVFGALEEGLTWYRQCRQAKGDPAVIAEASRSFLRMVRHIILAVLAAIGARAKIRGLTGGGAAAGARAAGSSGGSAVGEGVEGGGASAAGRGSPPSNVIPFRPRPATGPVAQRPVEFPTQGSGALKPQELPFEEPVPSSGVRPVPRPAGASPPATAGPSPRAPTRPFPVIPTPELSPEPRQREQDKCTFTEEFPLGGNKEHDAVARLVTGKPVEYTVRRGRFAARYDGMDAIGTLYEVKTRHDFLNLLDQPGARLGPRGRRVIGEAVPGLIAQVENQEMVAALCGREYRLATNNPRVLTILRELFPTVPVELFPFSFENEDR